MKTDLTGVIIRDQRAGRERSYLGAKIAEDGSVVLEGWDAGPLAEQFLGDWDYEYWLTIEPQDKDKLLLQFIKSHFSRFGSIQDFKSWLAEHGIEAVWSAY